VTDPIQPRPRGRHADPDSAAGRPAAELLAAWADGGSDTLQLSEETVRPRRRRRYAPETDAAGLQVLPPRGSVDVADVEITGLDASGIADVGLAAAGLDLSAFGIDRQTAAPRRPSAGPSAWPWAGTAGTDLAPRTTEMTAAPPPVVPHLAGNVAGRATVDRRTAPAPRPATEPTTADRVVADRFVDADTDPGWLSATGRQAPVAGAAGQTDQAPAAARGSLAALFDTSSAGSRAGSHPALSTEGQDEPATEVQAALSTGELVRRDRAVAEALRVLDARHHGQQGEDDDPAHHEEHGLIDDNEHDHSRPATGFAETGGLEVVVLGDHDDHDDHDDLLDGGSGGGGRGGRGGGRGGRGNGGRARKRRGPIAIVLSLIVLVGLVAGIAVGGFLLWRTINPLAEDYTGSGSGSVDVKINDGDSLRAIAGTLAGADVIASADPFEDAAKANAAATGIQPGIYTLRSKMSGQAALDLLLDPASRQVTRVTVPEGLTAAQVLQRLADQTGLPLADLQAAAADPAALGLPAYANGLVEGFLFPATYDIEPDDTPTDILSEMVAGTVSVLDGLQVPADQRLSVVTEASIVQAESGSVEDMGKVARVLDNRLADGMKLQLDTTVNYANGKSGVTTTAQDRANPSPYNTYANAGLPPGAISNPGEEAIKAVLAPTPGDWLFFVVVNPDTGETRFSVTDAEHAQNVLLFQQWLRDNPGN